MSNVINPYGTKTSAHSIAVWDVTPDTWVHHTKENIINKYFIKINGLTYKLDTNGEFTKVDVETPPTREDFENYGFDNLNDLVLFKDTVPPFRPIDKLDNQFSIIMGEYVPK